VTESSARMEREPAQVTSSSGRGRKVLIATVSALLAGTLLVFAVTSTTSAPSKKAVVLAPLSMPGLFGGTVRAPFGAPGHKGTPTVLLFFASWCTPCQAELPRITSYLAAHGRRDVAVVGVDGEAASAAARAFAAAKHLDVPVMTDPPPFRVASGIFNLPGFPDTVFIDATGHLVAAHFGEITTADFAHAYAAL